MPAIVGSPKNARGLIGTPKADFTADSTRIASSEWPPSAKKSS